MQLTIYSANYVGNKKNCVFPNKVIADNEADFMGAIERDHVLATYKDCRRASDNFEESDCVVMDCDNDHSEDPADWVSMQDFADSIPDVSVAIAPSRSHMKEKDGMSARPRFHAYFPIKLVTDPKKYVRLKGAIQEEFHIFDDNALDAARLIFGTPQNEVIWQEADMTIDEALALKAEEVIPEGRRNSTMSRFAGRVLIRYGDCDRAYEIFREHNDKCSPPLSDDELTLIWDSAKKFYKKISSQDGYVPPGEYEFGGDGSLKPEDFTDIGQAKVIVREYGNEIKFTTATDFLRYDGISWVESKQKALGAVIEFLDLQLKDAKDEVGRALRALKDAGISRGDIDAAGKRFKEDLSEMQQKLYDEYVAAKQYYSFVMKRRDAKYILSAMQVMKPMVEIGVDQLDADPFLLNTPSYTVDVRDGSMRQHSPDDLITKITAVDPSDEGKDLWLEAIDDFFCYDQDLIDYVQKMTALGVVGRVFIEAMIICFGSGSNGKSTYFNTIAKVLGSYYGSMSADALTVGCKRNTQYETAEAKGKRLLIAAELEEGQRLNTSFVKQMASTDMIFCQKKYKDPFFFTPSHTLVLYTNHLPKVSASDNGTWRRLIVIPFNATITGSADKKNYAHYLFEHAGGYVLKWLIEGAKKLIDEDFHIKAPKAVEDAIAKYRQDNDWIGHFINDCCDVDPSYSSKSGELYQEYRAYAARTGEFTRCTTDFYGALAGLGFEKQKTRDGMKILGIRIKPDDFDD